MKKNTFYTTLYTVVLVLICSAASAQLKPLNEDELAEITGQASLLDVDKYNFDTEGVTNNFYRLTLNSTITTSANIDKLRLKDSNGNDQISIDNLSLSGGINNQVSSAVLTNPFVEFAFAGDIDSNRANNREIIGIRVGAESMNGVLSFGEQHATDANQDTGINTFSGFLQTNSLSGTANTLEVTPDRGPYELTSGLVIVGFLGGTLDLESRVSIQPLSPNFTAPAVTINGTGETFSTISTNTIIVADPDTPGFDIETDGIPFTVTGNGTAEIDLGLFNLPVAANNIVANGRLANVQIDGTVTQDLKTIHNVSVNGSGFYLSAQNRPVKWRDSHTDTDPLLNDIAQPGWWLGITDTVNIAPITLDAIELPDSTIQDILRLASDELQKPENRIELDLSQVVQTLAGGLTVDDINVTLSDPNLAIGEAPVPLILQNQSLGSSQAHIINCWNGSLGC